MRDPCRHFSDGCEPLLDARFGVTSDAQVFSDDELDVLIGDYYNPQGPVSSIRSLIETALKGQSVTAFESFPPEALALENAVENGKVV